VYYTIDGGQNWQNTTITGVVEFWKLQFIDENTGWATVTKNGTGNLFKTIDGGINWNYVNSEADYYYEMCFVNNVVGYSSSPIGNGAFIKTEDGGYHWNDAQVPIGSAVHKINAVSEDLIFVGGSSFLYRKGETPIEFPNQVSNTTDTLFGVYFYDENLGWAVGDSGTILKTINGGDDWVVVTSGTSERLYSVHFDDENNGWIVGDHGIIMKSINGGDDWVVVTSGTSERLYSVYFADANNGWAVGENGTVMKSINGGDDWVVVTSGTSERLFDIDFPTGTDGWLVGDNGIIMKSTNGGDDWVVVTSGTSERLYDVNFVNPSTGWIVGDNGTLLQYTPAKSEGWVIVTSGTSERLMSVNFPTEDIGFVSGDNGFVMKTINGGDDWVVTTSGTSERLMSVSFPSDNEGWIVGSKGVILKFYIDVEVSSPNAGDNWQAGTKEDIKWKNQNVSKLKLEYSTDNGSTWNLIADSISTISQAYTWTIPELESTECLVKISKQENPNVADTTAGNFEISRFIITSPNGGEEWNNQNIEDITWKKGNRDSVRLEFSVDTGATWHLIIDSIPATQLQYSWDLPDSNSVYCLVKISDIKDSLMNDVSDTTFTISISANIESVGAEINMTTYPNPAQGQIVIDINEQDLSQATLTISDITGTIIDERQITSKQTQIDLSKYKKGIYFIKVSLQGRSRTDRVIIK
jgi:photosystem II stability/assembly factor-like uncharacterized protein